MPQNNVSSVIFSLVKATVQGVQLEEARKLFSSDLETGPWYGTK